MGTWGTGILQDDTVADLIGGFKDRIRQGESLTSAVGNVRKEFSYLEDDENEAPLVCLAIVHAQWKYGKAEVSVLDRKR